MLTSLPTLSRGARSVYHPEHKWTDIHRLLRQEQIGVLALQETHLSNEQADEIRDSFYGQRMSFFSSLDPDNPNSAGVAIILNNEITNSENASAIEIIPGRALCVTIPWHAQLRLNVLAIYAPNDPGSSREFWNNLDLLWKSKRLPIPDVMLGDFNFVEDQVDRLPHHTNEQHLLEAFTNLRFNLNLKDGWRCTYPDTKSYTYVHTTEASLSRIDRIYLSPKKHNNSRDWQISDVIEQLSDHRLVTFTLHSSNTPHIGPGRYAMKPHSLTNTAFLKETMALGEQMVNDMEQCINQRTPNNNPQTLWNKWKIQTIEIERKHAKTSSNLILTPNSLPHSRKNKRLVTQFIHSRIGTWTTPVVLLSQ
ncbi:DNase I-like protein [Dendrothele bispora CBS 962.96]|uniref:DNase I-like protein n=1 Tax=Dendrothele bispora (strain CBS 962.96) TaxID=1314807 RepID=A0A4S8LCZ5_DENBC|nr:DNase I-like protein [Dendrothele bispora CBS 962.96]